MVNQDLRDLMLREVEHRIRCMGGTSCSVMTHLDKDHDSPRHKATMSWATLMTKSTQITSKFGDSSL